MGAGSNKSNQSNSSMSNSSGAGVNSGIGLNFGMTNGGTFGTNNSANNSFNQSTGKSSGGSSSSSASNDRIWGAQSPYLQDMYKQAQGAFNSAKSDIDALTPEMTQQIKDTYLRGSDVFGNQSQGGFSAGMMDKVGQNNYLDSLKGDILSDAGKLKQQTLGSLEARAAAAGMSGSSGYRSQVADSYGEIDDAALQQMNQLGYNSFNQGIQNQIGLAGQADANQMNALGQTGAMQQAAMGEANPAMLQQMLAHQYAQTIGGPTSLNSASSQSSSSNSSNNNSMGVSNGFANGMNMGFNNGMNIGGNINSGLNVNNSNSTGSGSGSSSGWNITAPTIAGV